MNERGSQTKRHPPRGATRNVTLLVGTGATPVIRCPSCRFVLRLSSHAHDLRLPEECPLCHVRQPVDGHARLAARLAGARVGSDG